MHASGSSAWHADRVTEASVSSFLIVNSVGGERSTRQIANPTQTLFYTLRFIGKKKKKKIRIQFELPRVVKTPQLDEKFRFPRKRCLHPTRPPRRENLLSDPWKIRKGIPKGRVKSLEISEWTGTAKSAGPLARQKCPSYRSIDGNTRRILNEFRVSLSIDREKRHAAVADRWNNYTRSDADASSLFLFNVKRLWDKTSLRMEDNCENESEETIQQKTTI